jgi:hypothetical protein
LAMVVMAMAMSVLLSTIADGGFFLMKFCT